MPFEGDRVNFAVKFTFFMQYDDTRVILECEKQQYSATNK